MKRWESPLRQKSKETAEASGLSSSPAWQRIKRLKDLGVITGHVALFDRHRLKLTVLTYIQISLTDHTEPTVARFDTFVRDHPPQGSRFRRRYNRRKR